MIKKTKNTFHYTSIAIRLLERMLGSQFNIDGIENLPKNQPILFVCNHFTRSETFIIPYIIYKHTSKQVRCLADHSLFKGNLGKFLNRVGALSTKDKTRNDSIISDLMTANYNWLIYPEGAMVKSKEIYNLGKYISHTPGRIGRTRTGAAVLGLKSQLYRNNLYDCKKGSKVACFFADKYFVAKEDLPEGVNTHIVPVNITYYPIRPGDNIIKKIASRFFKHLPKKIAEELEIEGNIILSSNVNVSFGKSINLGDYTNKVNNLVNKIPIINHEYKVDLVLKYLKYRLTRKFMSEIYLNTKINIDHIFSAILYCYAGDEINIDHFKRLIYISVHFIKKTSKYRLGESVEEDRLYKILIDEPHKEFDSVMKLAKSLKIIKDSKNLNSYTINKDKLYKKYDFHKIRLENTFQVMANEFFLLDAASNIVKQNIALDEEEIKTQVFKELFNKDLENFECDYKKYYDPQLSKTKDIGSPFFLDVDSENKSEVGVLISHGYQAAPKEVEDLAIHLNKMGFRVYATRLKGHGTAPENIKDISWQDWYDSYQRGYAALRTVCSKVILAGFSTGGLLALLSCAKKNNQNIQAVIAINSALKLKNIKAKMVPGINIWNDILYKFKIQKGRLEYIKNDSENPKCNYLYNYLHGVEELGLLMGKCRSELKNVHAESLIIHSKHDPVVDPKSGEIIMDKINSEHKQLVEIDADKHIIVTGKYSKKIFEVIDGFLVDKGLVKVKNNK